MKITHFLVLGPFLFFIHEIHGANILFMGMPQSSSHRRSMYPLAEALADHGHKITFVSELAHDEGLRSKHPNVTDELLIIEHDDREFCELWVYRNSSGFRDIQWTMHSDYPWIWDLYWGMMIDVCRITVSQKHQDLARIAKSQKWDLIVVDGIFTPCGILLTKLINDAPYIIFSPTCVNAAESSHWSLPFPVATIPPFASLFNHDHTKFYYRMHGLISYAIEYILPFNWDRKLNAVVKQKYADYANLVTRFFRNAEFSFTDMIYDATRPVLPDILNTAGHCSQVEVLTDPDWLTFIEDPKSKGTILLSFGHIVQWRWAPDEIVDSLLQAFDRFPEYRIIFQYDGAQRRTESHVKTVPWLPVVQILGHPKTKVHLTHGGAKSMTETICAKVPMIISPVFAEQVRNARQIVQIGCGLALDKFNLTVENIVNALKTVLEDDRYGKRVERLRAYTIETIKPGLENGVFWAKQIIKRKRLPDAYFKHKGRHLSWIAYFNLDVLAVIGLVIAFFMWVFLKLVCISARYVCSKDK